MHESELERWFWSSLQASFLRWVDKTDTCWNWTGVKNKYGYGKITIMRKSFAAHRVSWEINRGPIPKGLNVLHHCDNPGCVNPDHLYTGTQSQNILESVAKRRQIGNRKLTLKQVAEIRTLRLSVTSTELASRFGVSRHTIQNIWSGVTWK